jgi:hypothetical protein
MRASPKLFFLLLPLLGLTGRRAFSASAGAIRQAERYDYAGYRLSTWHRDREAIVYYTAAIKANSADFAAHFNRAGCYLNEREWSKALEDCNTAVKLKPAYPDTYYLRAAALYRLGRDAESRADLERSERSKTSDATRRGIAALRVDLCQASVHPAPEEIRSSLATLDHSVALARGSSAVADALNERAWFRAVCRVSSKRDGQQSVVDATEACRLTRWRDRNQLDTLAAAYAQTGDFARAIEIEHKAIALAWNDRTVRETFKQHLGTFEHQQPIRLTAADR